MSDIKQEGYIYEKKSNCCLIMCSIGSIYGNGLRSKIRFKGRVRVF